MEEFIISLASLLILVPIVYFLPLGLSNQGKVILVVIAFLLANVGLFAQSNFPLWQTGLILLLLITLSAYILDKRLGKLFYSKLQTEEKNPFDVEDSLDNTTSLIIDNEQENVYQYNESVNKEALIDSTDENMIEIVDKTTNLEQLITTSDISEIEVDDVELEDIIHSDQLEITTDEMSSLEEDISFLNDREQLIEINDNMVIDEQHSSSSEVVLSELSDIERLLEEDKDLESIVFEDDTNEEKLELEEIEELGFEMKDLQLAEDHLEGTDLEHPSISSPLEEEMELEEIKFDSAEEELSPLESEIIEEVEALSFVETYKQVAVSLDQEAEDNEDTQAAHIQQEDDKNDDAQAAYIQHEDENNNEKDVEMNKEETGLKSVDYEQTDQMAVDEIEEEVVVNQQKTILQQKLFHTMVDQLHLARKTMQPAKYEELIKAHMHPEMSAQDYYTFASLLIQHYISQQEKDKLKQLLLVLKDKMEKYPVLEMEIHYLYEQYC